MYGVIKEKNVRKYRVILWRKVGKKMYDVLKIRGRRNAHKYVVISRKMYDMIRW